MDLLSIATTINQDWKIMVVVFGLGAIWYQARAWFKKLTDALDNTANTHNLQNKLLDNINDKLDNLDRRTAKIEGSIELIQHENNQQAIKLAVLETQAEIIDHPVKRRPRRQQS
jgi:uncharacterized protein YllA (UPF0747 family)